MPCRRCADCMLRLAVGQIKNTARLIALAWSKFEELLGVHHHMAAMIYRRFDALCRALRACNVQLVRTPIKALSDLTSTI